MRRVTATESFPAKPEDDLTTAVAHLPQHVQDQGGTGNEGVGTSSKHPIFLQQRLADVHLGDETFFGCNNMCVVYDVVPELPFRAGGEERPSELMQQLEDLQLLCNDCAGTGAPQPP